MGLNSRCICPDVLEQFINDWFFIYTENDTEAFFDVQWQLVDVGVNYIVVRVCCRHRRNSNSNPLLQSNCWLSRSTSGSNAVKQIKITKAVAEPNLVPLQPFFRLGLVVAAPNKAPEVLAKQISYIPLNFFFSNSPASINDVAVLIN